MTTKIIGLRVVRGPDWLWKDQDGGEGGVGTVISSSQERGNVTVLWDIGFKNNYRTGYSSHFDLQVLDSAPTGVFHHDIKCASCNTIGIWGARWSCDICTSVNLCSRCYNEGKHDLNHSFVRHDNLNMAGEPVGKRSGGRRVEAKGIFPNSTVTRGHDFEIRDTNGSQGKSGKVQQIKHYSNSSGNSGAMVCWANSNNSELYRLGHEGKVDLLCQTATSGGHYYVDHLAVLGRPVRTREQQAASNFKAGMSVRVGLTPDILRQMQESHRSWSEKMVGYINKVGFVQRVDENVTVRYLDGQEFAYYPDVLTIVDSAHPLPLPLKPTVNSPPPPPAADPSIVKELEKKVEELEEKGKCKICMDRKCDVVFQCGHPVCKECGKGLFACHICRQAIKLRIDFYEP